MALVSRHADGIDRSSAAAPVALEAHPPGVVARRTGKIRVGGTGRHITTADRALTGRASRDDDNPAVPRQDPVIVHDLIATDRGRCCRLVRGLVVDRHAGDKRPNPPRFLEKSDQAIHYFRAVRKRPAPTRLAAARRHYARWKVSEGLWEKASRRQEVFVRLTNG